MLECQYPILREVGPRGPMVNEDDLIFMADIPPEMLRICNSYRRISEPTENPNIERLLKGMFVC